MKLSNAMRHRSHRWVIVFAALSLASTAAEADKLFAVTPSGATEMLFPQEPHEAAGKLSSKCIDVHWTVTSSSTNEVVCEAPLNMGQSILGQMLLGNSYSTPPRRFFRFNVTEVNGVSRVQASGWMELQMVFGQMKRTDFSGASFENGMMLFMGAAGGKYPLGTTFPNHVAMGVDGDTFTVGKEERFRITRLWPGMSAEKAGMHVSDVVRKIAGKTFKNADTYLDAAAKAAETPTYEVEVLRGDKPMTFTLERAFRPAWAEAVKPEAAVSAPAPVSIADELLKLKKLQDGGVITQAEFDAQKAKLLGERP